MQVADRAKQNLSIGGKKGGQISAATQWGKPISLVSHDTTLTEKTDCLGVIAKDTKAERAKQRQIKAGELYGRGKDDSLVSNETTLNEKGKAMDLAAQKVNLSPTTYYRAKQRQFNANPNGVNQYSKEDISSNELKTSEGQARDLAAQKVNLVCPECGSSRAFKNGKRTLADGTKQQTYICRECTHRYTFEPSLNSEKDNVDTCRISADMVKNLVVPSEQVFEGDAKLETFLWYMKKQGYSESTIASRGTRLKRLEKLEADLSDPESVKSVIAQQDQWKPGMKEAVVFAYDLYAKYYGYKWERPRYKAVREIPFIPQEREIDDLIAGVNKEISLLLQIAKETGARAGEIYRLLWENIDFEAHTISIKAEKNSNPRLCKMSRKLQNLLECQPTKTERVFNQYISLNNLRRTFERQRKRLAVKLANPRLNKIKIHTLRHWKGTMEYHRTKDILHVMETLGHKSIKNTLLYTQLLKEDKPENYICKIARTPEEAAELIEAGFELHCEFGEQKEVKLFRKPK